MKLSITAFFSTLLYHQLTCAHSSHETNFILLTHTNSDWIPTISMSPQHSTAYALHNTPNHTQHPYSSSNDVSHSFVVFHCFFLIIFLIFFFQFLLFSVCFFFRYSLFSCFHIFFSFSIPSSFSVCPIPFLISLLFLRNYFYSFLHELPSLWISCTTDDVFGHVFDVSIFPFFAWYPRYFEIDVNPNIAFLPVTSWIPSIVSSSKFSIDFYEPLLSVLDVDNLRSRVTTSDGRGWQISRPFLRWLWS